jgi:ADP-ribose pyrophosphatase YjhB (NUDIX family)
VPEQVPRIVVGALITNNKGEILLTTAEKWNGQWVVQGGHLHYGESLEDAVRREIKEETNHDVTDINFVCITESILPGDYYQKKHMVMIDYSCKAPNTNQIKLNSELQEFKWVSPEEALKMNITKETRFFIQEFLKKQKAQVC